MTKRLGFTLAEVLITLGIIGVVAAMTIPTLISNTNGAQFKTAYKKALSVLNQAAVMNVALEDTDFSTIDKDGTKGSSNTMEKILTDRTMATYEGSTLYDDAGLTVEFKNANSPLNTLSTASNKFNSFTFPDGTSFSYVADNAKCTKDRTKTVEEAEAEADLCLGFIDVNGVKGPNKEIVCTNLDGDVNDKAADGDSSPAEACYVTNDTIGNGDIYPVYIYDQQIVPATDAAKAVLYGNDKAPATKTE